MEKNSFLSYPGSIILRNFTVTLPFCFLYPFVSQNKPEFSATGTQGMPRYLYKAKAPDLYSPLRPTFILVPSGKITIGRLSLAQLLA